VRVEARKGEFLYLNDGTYGSLFDAGTPKFLFPCRRLDPSNTQSANQKEESSLRPFSFYGPTCDTMDFMKGPFMLPSDIQEGDYIEIGQLGAYGRTMATRFNGFSLASHVVTVTDEPLMRHQLPTRELKKRAV
jgi:ornithine decarboxylase